ncbi:MAG: retropepsin-like aspartic protease, partial [Pseudomonadota bacterium]
VGGRHGPGQTDASRGARAGGAGFVVEWLRRRERARGDQDIVNSLPNKFNIGVDKFINAAGTEFTANKYLLKSLNISGMRFKDVAINEFIDWGVVYNHTSNSSGSSNRAEYQGVMGTYLFKGRVVVIDPLGGKLVIADTETELTGKYKHLLNQPKYDFKFNNRKITTSVNINKNRLDVIIDTGANLNLVQPEVAQKLALRTQQCQLHVAGGNGCVMGMADLSIGRQRYGIYKMLIYPIAVENIKVLLGYNSFDNRQLMFNFANYSWRWH